MRNLVLAPGQEHPKVKNLWFVFGNIRMVQMASKSMARQVGARMGKVPKIGFSQESWLKYAVKNIVLMMVLVMYVYRRRRQRMLKM